VIIDRQRTLHWRPHIVLQLRHVLSAAASSEKVQGSMNLASTPRRQINPPSRVAAIHLITVQDPL